MKKLFFYGFASLVLGLVSCDKITDPIVKKDVVVGTNFVTKSNAAISHFKKVLLEDYTGHTCGNCPAAADVAKQQADKYKDTIVVIAVHAGFFAKVKLPEYPASYTTTAGNDWDATSGFGVSNVGNPNGMVNRKNYAGNGLVQKETKWPTTIGIAIKDPMIVRLNVVTKYDTLVRSLSTDINAKFVAPYTNSIKISAVLIEDGIVGAQTDYRFSPDLIEDYDFEHMLRGSLNGSWGEVLKNGPIAVNDSAKVSYPNLGLSTDFKDKKVSVVVFAYDGTTREVLQVEKVKIR
jgi:thiol-disulfide isomerase/thioredoxin